MRKIVLLLIALPVIQLSWAQRTLNEVSDDCLFQEAMILFEAEKYVAAKSGFENYIAVSNLNEPRRIDAEYYQGICALYLTHPDAEYLLTTFVHVHPDSHWKPNVYLELGGFYYKAKQYAKCIEWFSKLEERELRDEEKDAYHYKIGYSYYILGQKEASKETKKQDKIEDYNKSARIHFLKIKDGQSEYANAANYYYSYLAYLGKDYQVALDGFLKIQNSTEFKAVVPYFIAQIYYVQKRYEELLAYAPPIINAEENVKNNYPNANEEIAHLIGDAYFILEKYTEALPYFNKYHQSPKSNPTREDFYQYGFTLYRNGQFQEAITAYNKCADGQDKMAQLANYNMGDCYLKLNQKDYARGYFETASKMNFDTSIQEDAMFTYAKLSFELSYNPFHEAITAFEEFLEKYPSSPLHDEAYEFLLEVYLKSKNYERALQSLDKIKNKDVKIKTTYQWIAFNRGVELFQADSYAKSEEFFQKSMTYPQNPELVGQAKFWMAEANYKLAKYSKAKELYAAAIQEPAIFNSAYYGLSNYGLGYCNFKMGVAQKDYDESLPYYMNANSAFRKFVEVKEAEEAKRADAYLRIGDCFYVNKSYKQAIEAYQKGTPSQKDYITYQSALCYGLDGNNSKKIELLKSLTNQGALTKFKVDAAVELASTYVTEEKFADARDLYKQVLVDQPQSSYTRGILVDLCLIYRELNNEDKVRETWNKLYTDYSTDQIIIDALSIVKPVLIDDVEFQNQIKSLKIANVSELQIENEVFEKAAAPAYAGDCEKGKTRLLNYLHQYPQAVNASEANFIIATCLFDAGAKDEAVTYFERVIELPFSNYTEESLNKAASIRIQQGEFANAIGHLLKIESAAISKSSIANAQVALMSSYYAITEYGMAREYADKVIADVNAEADNQSLAYLYRARIKMTEQEFDSALADFKEVAKGGGDGAAESAYNHAFVEYKRGEYVQAEKSIFKTIEKFSSFEKWKLESFLLLAEVYMKKPDWVQCRKTLDNIITKVKDPTVVERARQLKLQLEELENPRSADPNTLDPSENESNEEFNENE